MYLLKYNHNNYRVYFFYRDATALYYLLKEITPEYIVPTVPLQVIGSVILSFFNAKSINVMTDEKSAKEFVDTADKELILSSNLSQAYVCLSYAKEGEICPDNCTGPEDRCPNFNREKSITITKYLMDFFHQSSVFVVKGEDPINLRIIVESNQLAPGLGGIKGIIVQEIIAKLNQLYKEFQNKNVEIKVATSCNCHGIVNFYKIQP